MRFSQYFDNWSKKYYSNYAKVGKKGDFFTAVSVGELFGFLCAKRFVALVEKNEIKLPVDIVEIGANEGYLINDFRTFLKQNHNEIFKQVTFNIIEPHENLRRIQKKNLKFEFSHYYLDDFYSNNVFFLANELFDAFACELYENNKFGFIEDGKIVFKEVQNDVLYFQNSNFKKGEFCPEIFEFLKTLCKNCKEFYFLTFDYFNEFLSDEFSIRVFKNHQIYSLFEINLNEFYGVSDITYNVNFDEFSFYLKKLNLIYNLKKQSLAFLDFGISEFSDPKFINQIKYLMFAFSDNFKCLEFKKERKCKKTHS